MQQIVTTAGGRRLVFTATPNEYGRVVYEVARVGAFTLEPEAYTYDSGDGQQRVHLRYGRVDGPERYRQDRDLPDAPVVCTVALGGSAVFRVEHLDEPSWRWLSVCRANGGSAPEGTRRRTADIVHALVTDWLARDDHEELRGYHAWHLAPARIANARHTIGRLQKAIAPHLSELAAEYHRCAEQMAILGEVAHEPRPFPDPQTRDGQAILALRAELAEFYQQHRYLPAVQVAALVERWLDEQGLAVAKR